MLLFLAGGGMLVVRSAVVNTGERMGRIYRWTDIRHRQLFRLAGCVFSCTMAVECFDDAQRIATAGTGFSNWLAVGTLPAAVYHAAVLAGAFAMVPFHFALFLYKAYHTEKGSPNAGIVAEMTILTVLPVATVMAHYLARAVLFLLNQCGADDLYGAAAAVKAGWFLLSVLYLFHDTYTLRKSLVDSKREVKRPKGSPLRIWEKESSLHRVKKAERNIPAWIGHMREWLRWQVRRRK